MKLRRVLSLLLAAAMVFSPAAMAPASASDGADSAVTASEEASDIDAEKQAEEEAKKKAEEEAAKKAEEEAKKKEEEEAAQKAEEEKQQQEEAEKSGSSESSSEGDSSEVPADSSSSGSGSENGSDSSSSSGGSSADPADHSGSGGDVPSSSGSESTGEDPADEPNEEPTAAPEAEPENKEEEEELTAQASSSGAAKKISDKTYSSTQTVTAAAFSDYSNSSGMASGASVTYKRLITYRVTGLVANKKSAGKSNLSQIEKVMRMIRDYNAAGTYSNTVFKVVIPKGTYYLDGTYTSSSNRCIHLYSNTWLSMNGVTLIKSDTLNRASLRTGMSSSSVSGYTGESNIILEGGAWDVNADAYSSSGKKHFTNIRFGHGQNIIIANVVFEGAVSGHHVELCGVKNVSVVGCSFLDYKDSGYTKGINRNEALQIDVTNSANVTPSFRRYDDTISGNVVVYNNTFENVNRGVGSHSAIFGAYYQGIAIESNTFENVTNQAIFCENYQDCAIKNNTVTDCGGGIEFNTLCYAPDGNYYSPNAGMPDYDSMKTCAANAVISGNSIAVDTESALTNASGIYVHGGVYSGSKYSELKGKPFTLSGVTVTENTITGCRDAGIMLAYTSGCKVTKNKISGVVGGSTVKGYGIYLDSSTDSGISSNTVRKVGSHALVLSGCSGAREKKLSISGNQLSATGGIGLYLTSSQYISAGKNSVSASSYAVYLKNCACCTIGSKSSPNTLRTSAKYGVFVSGNSKTEIRIHYNKITARTAALKVAKGCAASNKNNTFRKYGGSR